MLEQRHVAIYTPCSVRLAPHAEPARSALVATALAHRFVASVLEQRHVAIYTPCSVRLAPHAEPARGALVATALAYRFVAAVGS